MLGFNEIRKVRHLKSLDSIVMYVELLAANCKFFLENANLLMISHCSRSTSKLLLQSCWMNVYNWFGFASCEWILLTCKSICFGMDHMGEVRCWF